MKHKPAAKAARSKSNGLLPSGSLCYTPLARDLKVSLLAGYVLVIYKLFCTHNRAKDIGHFLVQNLFENVNTVREEETTWSGRLPRAFCSSFPLKLLSHSPS